MLKRPFSRFFLYQALKTRSRRYCSSSASEAEPESWKSMKGLLRCPANYVPLSPIGFLERSSVAYRDTTSIVYGSLRYTWFQTHQRCLKLASALTQNFGISRGDVVATFSHNHPGIYELHFAIPMAGAVLCTLNARHDASMVSILLRHSEAKLLFVDTHSLPTASRALELLAQTDQTKPPILVLLTTDSETGVDSDSDSHAYDYEDLVRTGSDEFEIRRPRSEWDPISINYTSGTTSRPKGVVYSHRGAYLNSLATVLLHNMGGVTRPVYLWTVPMFHCNGWCLPWGSAAQGATNICVRKVSPKVIFDAIAAHRVTHMGGVPTVLNSIVNSPADDRKPLPHAVDVLTGGSPPPPQIMAKMEEMGFRVNHIYGLTEVFGPGTNCVVKPEWDELPVEDKYRMRARQGVRHLGLEDVDVRDPVTMKSVPADGNTVGEIMFRGNTVMSGYLKDKKSTEEAFQGGWFRSGDLAVKHPDCYIEVKDRIKDVIISGGENISTIEVETVLYGHDAVLEAAVVGRPHEHWGETPCAFVTLKEGFRGRVSAEEIIAFCRDRLPHYMAPRSVVFEELPKTSTGKIQKFVLRERAKAMGSL